MPDYQACPKCAGTTATEVKYSLWGGALGPWLLTHVKCAACGSTYNGKTGRSNLAAIVVYQVVVALLIIGAVIWFWSTLSPFFGSSRR